MKLLIAIGSCQLWEANGNNQAVRDTWMKDIPSCTVDGYSERIIDCFFFHGRGAEEKPDVVILDVPDDKLGIVRKTKAIHAWAYQRDYDFVLQVWSDTFVDVSQILLSGFEKYDYFGSVHSGTGAPHAQWGFHCGGEGWWTSRAACKAIKDSDVDGELPKYDYGMADDLWVGDVVGAAGFSMTDHLGYGNGITLHGSFHTSGDYNKEWMYQTYDNRRQSS